MSAYSSTAKLWPHILLSVFLIPFCVSCLADKARVSASLVADLDAELPVVITNGNSPSTQVAVVQRDQIIWSRAFGQNTSIRHAYMNASVQKMFTAVAVLQLVERGFVELDTNVQDYLPFAVEHPGFPMTPITVRMLLAQRSGLKDFPHQFAWDTGCAFSPQYRPCPGDSVLTLSLEAFLRASLVPGGSNYDQQTWGAEPGKEYYYSVSAYPLLRYLISHVTGQNYAEYMHENIFDPLEMRNSGFGVDEFAEHHTIPHTRIDGANMELPMWNGQGSMMHTTAEDMARFMQTLLNDGQYNDFLLLQSETIALMQQRASRFRVFLRSSDDLPSTGFGLGLISFRGGWLGFGGSAPGYQCLLRYHPSRQVGYVILVNVNAILGGGDNYKSARREIYEVQDALVAILDPTLVIRYRAGEVLIFVLAGAVWAIFMRKRPRITVASGGVWSLFGGIWMFTSIPLGLGFLVMGVIVLVWGGINLIRQRQTPLETDV